MAVAMAETSRGFIGVLARNTDALLGLLVLGIVIVMIIPIPPLMMDMLLSFSITFSIVIMLVSMYILKPLEFSVFPSILLVATLARLSLNVASTRLILLRGHEGTDAAGNVINFVVITKGAGRIAEVAARFTLDAMPGKQMSIDADLNAGLIDDTEARRRRLAVAREAEFYWAIDCANKFVRGDAVAGIIITIINIIGGLVIGILQHGMSIGAAAQNYTLLTIGDGLVSQIPALIVSTSAGVIVTRAASESNLGAEISKQILIHPKAIGISAAIIFFLALIPGLPHLPFIVFSIVTAIVAWVAYYLKNTMGAEIGWSPRAASVREGRGGKGEAEAQKGKSRDEEEGVPLLDVMELNLGYGLIPRSE